MVLINLFFSLHLAVENLGCLFDGELRFVSRYEPARALFPFLDSGHQKPDSDQLQIGIRIRHGEDIWICAEVADGRINAKLNRTSVCMGCKRE